MKHIYLFFFPVIVLFSCQKERQQQKASYITNVKASLKDSLVAQDYNSFDFERAVLSKADKLSLYFLRISFKGKKLQNDFVLVQTNSDGKVQREESFI
jgi:hypothetical protein